MDNAEKKPWDSVDPKEVIKGKQGSYLVSCEHGSEVLQIDRFGRLTIVDGERTLNFEIRSTDSGVVQIYVGRTGEPYRISAIAALCLANDLSRCGEAALETFAAKVQRLPLPLKRS